MKHKQHIGKYQIRMMQTLIEMEKANIKEWQKECKRIKVTSGVFYNNKTLFLEKDLITIYMDIVTPNLEKVKEYFGKYIHINKY